MTALTLTLLLSVTVALFQDAPPAAAPRPQAGAFARASQDEAAEEDDEAALGDSDEADATRVIEHHVAVDEHITLRARELGEGRAVLLLTGGPGFAGATMLPWAEHLATAGHRAILPDQRGTGASTVTIEMTAFDLPSLVADLEAVREALGVDTWTLVGHSWGGILSMAYASRHPQRVQALTLVDPGGLEPSFFATYQANIMVRLDDDARTALGNLRPGGTDLASFGEMVRRSNVLMAPGMVAREQALPALLELLAPGMFEPSVTLAMQPTLGQLDLTEAVGAYTGPVLVLQGEHDPIGRAAVDAIVAAFDHATLEVLPGVGHWPDLEDPDTLFRRLDGWLTETGPTGGDETANEAERPPSRR